MSHARNRGNAVVVKCDKITDLEDYLFGLLQRLDASLFDIVLVQLNSSPLEHHTYILDILARLEKSREYKRENYLWKHSLKSNKGFKRKLAKENECKRQSVAVLPEAHTLNQKSILTGV